MLEYPDPKVQAMVNALVGQRNDALDRLAVSAADLAESNQAILALSAKVAELQKRLDEPEAT